MADFNYTTTGGVLLYGTAIVPSFQYIATPLGVVFTTDDFTDAGYTLSPLLLQLGNQNNFFGGGGLGGDPAFIVPLGYFSGVDSPGSALGPYLIISDFIYEGSGEIVISGQADAISSAYNYTGGGTVVISGDADDGSNKSYIGSGDVVISGEAIAFAGAGGDPNFIIPLGYYQIVDDFGSSPLGPFLMNELIYSYVGSGEVVISGFADVISSAYTYTGGGDITLSGEAEFIVGYIDVGSGDVIISGDALANVNIPYIGGGDVVISGDADDGSNKSYIGSGDVVISGDALATFATNNSYIGSGTIILDGIALRARTSYRYIPTGGITINGSAISIEKTNYYIYDGSGAITLSGEAEYPYFYTGSGGIELGNNLIPAIVSVTYESVIDFSWDIEGIISNEVEFLWNVGRQPTYYFRIVGACLTPTCENSGYDLGTNGCGKMTFTQIIEATDLADLCGKLIDLGYTWQIISISRWSRPVKTSDIEAQELLGIDHSCNKLEPIDFTQVPECFELTAQKVDPIKMGMSALVQDAFYAYEGSGTIYLGGTAKLPTYSYVGSGLLTISGEVETSLGEYSYVGSGDILLDGEAEIIFDTWYYTGFGDITISGDAAYNTTNYSAIGFGNITIGGQSDSLVKYSFTPIFPFIYIGGEALVDTPIMNFAYVGGGDIVISGESESGANIWNYEGGGDIVISGDALVASPNQHYVGSGGVVLGGEVSIGYNYVGSGNITLGDTAIITYATAYVGDGDIVISGEIVTESPSYVYEGSGIITISGSAVARSNYFEGTATLGGTIANVLLEGDFAEQDVDGPPLTPETETVTTNCGCNPLPLSLQLTHNLTNANILGEFIKRNGISFGTTTQLQYRNFDNTWQKNFHFTGISERNMLEKWTMVFEWGCTTTLGEDELDRPAWKFSASISRKNLITLEDEDTRILYIFPMEPVCKQGQLKFGFTVNTKTGVVSATDVTEILGNILYDNIGLFKSKFWIKNLLKVNIESIPVNNVVNKFDIFPIFPTGENIFSPN